MKSVRQKFSALLVGILVLVTGLSSTAHALSKDCGRGHSDERMPEMVEAQFVGHSVVDLIGGKPHGPDRAEHDGCNPNICHAVGLGSGYSAMIPDHSKTILEWQVGHYLTMEEPDHPDKPPNL